MESLALYSNTDDDASDVVMTQQWTSTQVTKYVVFVLLSLQCGCQPLLVKIYMPTTVVRSTAVLAQEFSKLCISFMYLIFSNSWKEATEEWTLRDAIAAAGVPASLFVVQNYCNLFANQMLPPVTFVVLNQSKTLSTAWCCFMILGQKQSDVQVVALVMLVIATLVIQKIIPLDACAADRRDCRSPVKLSKQETEDPLEVEKLLQAEDGQNNELEKIIPTSSPLTPKSSSFHSTASLLKNRSNSADMDDEVDESSPPEGEDIKQDVDSSDPPSEEETATSELSMGILAALFASFISGLAGTMTQKTLQTHMRSPHLFNIELGVFSSFFLLASLAAGTPDCQKIKNSGIKQGWTWKTWIPIATNASGAILVGLVTKYHGAVVKGFAIIFGMVISGALQQICYGKEGGGVTREQFWGGCLGGISMWIHSTHPPKMA